MVNVNVINMYSGTSIHPDYFLPYTSGGTVNINILEGAELSDVDGLEYFMEMYLRTVKRGKPNIRAANNLKAMIDSIQVRYLINEAQIFRHSPSKNAIELYALTLA